MDFKPYKYQKYCIDRIINEDKLGLFLDMGLGKTVISLTAIDELMYNRFELNKVLIIAPKKVAELTWQNEAYKWEHLKHLRIINIAGSKNKRLQALYQRGDIFIISRDNVKWLVETLGANSWCFDMVVIDELSSFKNPKSQRFKSLKRVRPAIKKIVGLTGTPSPNGLEDLWAQVYLLDEGQRLFKTISQFRAVYFNSRCLPGMNINLYSAKAGAFEAASERISDICISMKSSDYLELPELITDPIYIELDSKASKAYDELEKKYVLELSEADISVESAAALSNKLLQLCNGFAYDENKKAHIVHTCKLEALEELIEKLNGEPLLLFYNFIQDRELIKSHFKEARELKCEQDMLDWNAGKIKILLAHPASCAYGLNLQQGGRHMLWYGLTWSLEYYQQAIKRLHRQGQNQNVIVHQLLVKGRRDEDVQKAIVGKEVDQEFLISSLKARIEEIRKKQK